MALEVTSRGDVPEDAPAYAEEQISGALVDVAQPVLSTHVVLTLEPDPAREKPALAEVNLDLDGAQVRAKAAAREIEQAVDIVTERLVRNVRRHEERVRSGHRRPEVHAEHEWRHGDEPSPWLDHYRRPLEERTVVRRKTLAVERVAVEAAIADMEVLGHDFYLYADAETGHDALVHHTPGGGYAVRGEVEPPEAATDAITYEGPEPRLDEAEARERIDVSEEPFVFYLDRDSGRGRVFYIRYDGNYGLITVE